MIGVMIMSLAAPNKVFVWNSVKPLLLLTNNKQFTYMLLEGDGIWYIFIYIYVDD